MEMEMEMDMNESPVMGNHSDDSIICFDSSAGTGGLFSPPLKRLRKSSTSTTTATATDDDNDSKTSSTRSSISEEFDGPLLSQPSDLQAVILTSTHTTIADDDTDNKTSSTRSSISEEFGGPLLSQPSDPFQPFFLTVTHTTIADDDTDNKTSSTRSSISEEFGGPLLSQPSDPFQTVLGEEIGKRRCTTIEEYVSGDYSLEECNDFYISIYRQTHPEPESEMEIETWRVDPDRLSCYARQALTYFKETTGKDYRYVGPRSMCLCSPPDSEYKVTHLNFFARPCGETSESLFFAALEHGPVRKVLECCTVPMFKAGDGVVACVKHPPRVDCSECSKFGDSALCFEVEEEPICIPWSSVI